MTAEEMEAKENTGSYLIVKQQWSSPTMLDNPLTM